jgi:hypothetical protein
MSREPVTVTCEPAPTGWSCHVKVGDATHGRPSEHEVLVTHDDLARLAPGAREPDDLVARSFDFLLRREPKESILRRFDLLVIARYFPEYETVIRRA